MIRGWKDKLEKYVNLNEDICVDMQICGNAEYDFCCFGVDPAEKLSDDRYMVFYNQRQSPEGELSLEDINGGVRFKLQLSKLSEKINRLIFTLSIDGTQTVGEMQSLTTKVYQAGKESIDLELTGKDFSNERAVIVIEIYRKDTWRIGFVAEIGRAHV